MLLFNDRNRLRCEKFKKVDQPALQSQTQKQVFDDSLSLIEFIYVQATMLKKIKSKRRLTEPHISSPAVVGGSQGDPENGDRDKEHPLSGT